MSTFTIGLLNQLGDAFENAGFSAEEITKLKQFKSLKGIKDILNGHAEIAYPEHLIDCDAAPYIPEGFTLVSHKKGGQWKWNPSISFYLSKKQKKGGYSVGNDLRKALESQPVLNANVLDHLIAHQELIPESWKGKTIFFWGTIYRNSDGSLYVRFLYWDGSQWRWGSSYLDNDFHSNRPAALAS